jgi:hypothetical protein
VLKGIFLFFLIKADWISGSGLRPFIHSNPMRRKK